MNDAQTVQELAQIVADLSTTPGATQEVERLRRVLRDRTLTLEDKKREIIGGSSAEAPQQTSEENPAVRYNGPVGGRSNAARNSETAMVSEEGTQSQEVANARKQMEARGVDTMDAQQVKNALVADAKPIIEAGIQDFVKSGGTREEYLKMMSEELDMTAQLIVQDSQGGLV